MRKRAFSLDRGRKWFILFLGLAIFLVFSLLSPGVFTIKNIKNILIEASVTAIAGAGMTYAITLGGFDLSVGSILALTTCILGKLIPSLGIPLSVAIALAVACLCGFINSLIITKLKIQTFVTTLATMIIIQGIALIYTRGEFVSLFKYPQMKAFSAEEILGVPVPVLITAVVYLVCTFAYTSTRFGVYLRASGSNEKAAILSAVPLVRIKMLVFMITALTAALSGVIVTSQLLTGGAVYGSDFALEAITVVVLGGTSMRGGSGFLPGTLMAAIMISIIENGLNILGFSDDIQKLIVGLILLVSLAAGEAIYSDRKKSAKRDMA